MYTHLCVLREEGGSRGARKYVVPYQSKSSMPGVQFSPRIFQECFQHFSRHPEC